MDNRSERVPEGGDHHTKVSVPEDAQSGEKEEFLVDLEHDREPVEVVKGGDEVLPGPGVCVDSCS